MIVDHRTYTLHPGAVPEYFRMYEQEGLPIQRGHLVNLLGYYAVETGPLNQVIHLWGYRSAADREAKRAAMLADPAWQAYVKKVRPLIITQETKLIVPAPFFRLELQ